MECLNCCQKRPVPPQNTATAATNDKMVRKGVLKRNARLFQLFKLHRLSRCSHEQVLIVIVLRLSSRATSSGFRNYENQAHICVHKARKLIFAIHLTPSALYKHKLKVIKAHAHHCTTTGWHTATRTGAVGVGLETHSEPLPGAVQPSHGAAQLRPPPGQKGASLSLAKNPERPRRASLVRGRV
jgi:hypothetical protein